MIRKKSMNNKFGIGMLFLSILLITTIFVSAASAALNEDVNSIDVSTEQSIPEPEQNTILNTVSESKSESPYSYLLNADKEEKKILFSYIDNCYASTKEKEKMKKAMENIWKKYPSKVTADKITKEDNQTLEKVEIETAKYLNDKYGSGKIGVMWAPDTHVDLAYIVCNKLGINDKYANIAGDAADEPDYWSTPTKYSHYYNPDLKTGNAPLRCSQYMSAAKSYYKKNPKDYTNAYTNLGYAMHFMSDVGNPMHTGKELDTIEHKWVHDSYEQYILDNWKNGYKYRDMVTSDSTYYSITDPKQATIDLAKKSHPYMNTLFDTVYYHPSTFGSDQTVRSITKSCLIYTKRYDEGLVKYMRG
jgi:hypothetical protein